MQPSFGPDPDAAFPNPDIPLLCYIRNVVKNPRIIVGEYTYYNDADDPAGFEKRVTYHYEFMGDRLIIGKFCAIGSGVEFIMNGANHRMDAVTTYPFSLFGHGWEKSTPSVSDLPFKGDTAVGNDVWIGQNATILPGVRISDGAVIAANATVTKDVPAYHIAGGNPARILRRRFDDETVAFLLELMVGLARGKDLPQSGRAVLGRHRPHPQHRLNARCNRRTGASFGQHYTSQKRRTVYCADCL